MKILDLKPKKGALVCMVKKNCMIFSPHQDDACLGCGGVISKKIKSKEKVTVVDVTDGRNCFWLMFGIKKDPTPKETISIRKNEDKKAMKKLGVDEKDLFFLGYEDGLLYKHKAEAKNKILKLISEIKPSEIYICSTKDKHPDHVLTNVLVKECLKELDLDLRLYEYFIWSRFGIETNPPEDLIRIDIKNEIKNKKEAIECYKSKISKFTSTQKSPVLDEKFLSFFYKNHELFRRINSNKNESKIRNLISTLKLRYTILYYNRFRI